MNTNLRLVNSSNLKAVGWVDNVLTVEFIKGGVYEYTGVPRAVYASLMNAYSVGRYFSQCIKGRYQYAKVA